MNPDEQIFLDIKAELESIPPLLYKYCSIETAEKILSSTAVMLSSPRRFNDPFEMKFRVQWPDDKTMCTILEKEYPNPIELSEMIKLARERKTLYKGELSPEVQSFFDKMGISCFSTEKDSVLMWGHYAAKHGGICLGFNSLPLANATLKHASPKSPRLILSVHYEDKYPTWDMGKKSTSEMKRFFQKSSSWSYEKEWRIIISDGAGMLLPFPKEILAEIIFGVKATDESIEKIRKLAVDKGYSTKFIQAKRSATKYEIEFAPCPD